MKTIYLLFRQGSARGADIAKALNVSRATVSISLKSLQQEGYCKIRENHTVVLTPKGLAIAKEIIDRNNSFYEMLVELGVDKETALRDACNMEHAVSRESFCALMTLAECHEKCKRSSAAY